MRKNTTWIVDFHNPGILSILIEKYEDDQFKVDFPDPIEAIKFRMEQMGYTQADLAACIGYKSRVSEILQKRESWILI